MSVGLWISVMIWQFSFLMRISKNGGSLKLSSIVNFISGCKYWSRLCNSLMLPHGHLS